MSSLNLNNDGNGLSLDLNVPFLSQVPSSSSAPILGHEVSEKSEIPFESFNPLMIHPNGNENMVPNNEGYFGNGQKNMFLNNDEAEKEAKSMFYETQKFMNSNLFIRGHWRPNEDAKLKALVAEHGPQNWNTIAEHLHGRSGIIILNLNTTILFLLKLKHYLFNFLIVYFYFKKLNFSRNF